MYPLLAASHFSWCMLATETDPTSCQSALENVQKNGLAGQVAVRKVRWCGDMLVHLICYFLYAIIVQVIFIFVTIFIIFLSNKSELNTFYYCFKQ